MVNDALRLAILSKSKNLTEFCTDKNLNYNRVRRIVLGEQRPDADDIKNLCVALDVPDMDSANKLFSLF